METLSSSNLLAIVLRTDGQTDGQRTIATTYEYLDVGVGCWSSVEPGNVVDCVAQISTVARYLNNIHIFIVFIAGWSLGVVVTSSVA